MPPPASSSCVSDLDRTVVGEIVRDVRGAREADAADPLATVAAASDLTDAQVRLAAAYYTAYPEEIDARISAEDEFAEKLLACTV